MRDKLAMPTGMLSKATDSLFDRLELAGVHKDRLDCTSVRKACAVSALA